MSVRKSIDRFVHSTWLAVSLLAAGIASAHPGHGETDAAHVHGFDGLAVVIALSVFLSVLWGMHRVMNLRVRSGHSKSAE